MVDLWTFDKLVILIYPEMDYMDRWIGHKDIPGVIFYRCCLVAFKAAFQAFTMISDHRYSLLIACTHIIFSTVVFMFLIDPNPWTSANFTLQFEGSQTSKVNWRRSTGA